jgi:hypothetical protein
LHPRPLYPHTSANPRIEAAALGRQRNPPPVSTVIGQFNRETFMHFTSAHITPLVALIAGILILIVPRLLNYVVAIYLIVIGLVGLNGIYHFVK